MWMEGKAKYLVVVSIFTTISLVVFMFIITNASNYIPPNENHGLTPIITPPEVTTEAVPSGEIVDNQDTPSNNNSITTDILKSLPETLVIPKISVKANVEYVGVTSNGTIGTPSSPQDVAWYQSGTIPGQIGTAIIDGHLDNWLGFPAVFWKLQKLELGDEVDIVTKEGQTLHFVVNKINSYDYNDPNAVTEIFSEDGTPTIRLITCEGGWIQKQQTYDKRLVVSASLI